MKKWTAPSIAAITALIGILALAAGCAAKKQKSAEHFGTELNHPVFNGPADFFKSLNKVNKILWTKKLDGKPVDMSWIEPAFRERLCLTVTINNHCVA